ncbi:J domain-containing protein [Halorubrum trueperi]|uniref:J domain-containing protein n=1 Tax=Halorubrum trueperi TaxID=2004704 RepID=A0ABD5UEJ2_9EURY
MNTTEQRPDLDWPEGYPRTAPSEREPYPGNITLGHREAFESIDEELSRWGALLQRVEFAAPAYVNDSRIPHKSSDPDDPGVVAYFRREDDHADEGYAIACDRWDSLRDNARAIALYARRKRLAERCGVTTADSEFETARLPPGDEDAASSDVIAVEPEPDRDPHEVLGVAEGAPDPVVKGAFRELVKEAHGDQGGSEKWDVGELKQARDELLD